MFICGAVYKKNISHSKTSCYYSATFHNIYNSEKKKKSNT